MNCTSGDLASLVPTTNDAAVAVTSAPQVVVQVLPLSLGILLWVVLEAARRKRAASDRVRRAVRGITLLCTGAISLVVWRFVTVLTCDIGHASPVWNVLACAALVGASLAVLLALTLRNPRVAIGASLLIASGVAVTDVGLRGWWSVDGARAAQHLMPVQLLWVLHAVAVLFHLDRRSAITSSYPPSLSAPRSSQTRRPVVEVVDALARREHVPPLNGGACSERGRERSNLRV